jgi:nuclear mRNA export protein SAC3
MRKSELRKSLLPGGVFTEQIQVKNEETGRDIPSEPLMVKRFRRSAAGYDEQLPSDIRTPEALVRTTDYLMNKLVGGSERLAVVHKFVWDRTRAIRNDFSIQQVSKEDDVQRAVNCFERIARFHLLSMHQLCNPDNLHEDENFDFFQEREQLNNTLISLMFYYDDNRDALDFPNEPEFRAYLVIFEIQSQQPDLEDRLQSWPNHILRDPRVQTALRLYRAAGNTVFDQGPLKPTIPYAIAQNNSSSFWTILASSAVSYMTSCVAEIYFPIVRFAALNALWAAGKKAPMAMQAKMQDWTLSSLTDYLGFDTEQQTFEFCTGFGLVFGTTDQGSSFVSLSSPKFTSLDRTWHLPLFVPWG